MDTVQMSSSIPANEINHLTDSIHLGQDSHVGPLPIISEWLLLNDPPSAQENEEKPHKHNSKHSKLSPEERKEFLAKQAQRRREARRRVREDPEKYSSSKAREAEQKRLWRAKLRHENEEKYLLFKEKEAMRKKQYREGLRKKALEILHDSDSESLELLDAITNNTNCGPSSYNNGDNSH